MGNLLQDNLQQWNSAINLDPTFNTNPIAAILNKLIPFSIIIAGIILLIMLISGGFQMLTAATNPDLAEQGKKRITAALTGFVIIVTAYWVIQILETILGIHILN